ncbi:MAG: hypothetical protein Q4A54_09780 [Parabacteroides sp.]|nr:hypothetical protein [Parabacteroides sp.]
MSLSRLIDGQTIKIDNHNRGTHYKWDEAIHLHKRMNSDKYRGAQVIIPIAVDKELEFRSIDGKEIIEMQIKNEIEKAFSNNTIRTMFVKTLIDELTKLFTDNKIPKEKWNILFDEVAIRIVKYFGVKPKIKEKIGNEIIRFSQEKGLDIFVKASVKDESITLGTDFNLVNNFNI